MVLGSNNDEVKFFQNFHFGQKPQNDLQNRDFGLIPKIQYIDVFF